MARMFLLPLILSLVWWAFLHYNGLSIKQGAKGFYWIIGLSSFLAAFFTLMIYLTR